MKKLYDCKDIQKFILLSKIISRYFRQPVYSKQLTVQIFISSVIFLIDRSFNAITFI